MLLCGDVLFFVPLRDSLCFSEPNMVTFLSRDDDLRSFDELPTGLAFGRVAMIARVLGGNVSSRTRKA